MITFLLGSLGARLTDGVAGFADEVGRGLTICSRAGFTDGVGRGLPIEWMIGHFNGLGIVQIKTMHSATGRRCRLAATIRKYSNEDNDDADGRTDHNEKHPW